MTTYRVHMSHFLSTRVVQGARRFWLSGLSCLALVGCSAGLTPHIGVSEEKVPHEQVADYLSTTCDELWTLDGSIAENNPLYWLRGMDCPERQLIVSRLDAHSAQIPSRIRPLYQVWRDNQMLQLKLSDERTRYSKLQESSDAAMDELRQQQQALKGELDLTTRKLQNLTDIERQLSSRKPSSGFNPDSTHGTDAPADTEDKQ